MAIPAVCVPTPPRSFAVLPDTADQAFGIGDAPVNACLNSVGARTSGTLSLDDETRLGTFVSTEV